MTYEKALEDFARKQSNTGHVSLLRCDVCGDVDWLSTQRGGDFSYSVQPMLAGQCNRCGDVYRRSPELALWVLDVIAHQARKGVGTK